MAGGIPLSKLKSRRITGTTSATANEQAAVKETVPEEWKGCTVVEAILNGEGCYIEGGTIGTGRAGMNTPVASVVVDAAGASTYSRIINLSTNVWVAVYVDAGDTNKGKAAVITKNGTTLSVGTPVLFNNAVTTDIDAKKISATEFAVSYVDDGGDDYLGAKIGTVSGTTIAFGDERLMVSAAIVKTAGTGIAIARPGVLAVTYQLAGDTKHYIVASLFSGAVIAAAGTPVEVVATASTIIQAEMIGVGRVVVAYAVVSTTRVATAVCTVSAAGVCVAGTSEEHSTAAATSINITRASENRGILQWIDTGDLHILAFDIGASGTTLNEGADATLVGTHLYTSATLFNESAGVIAFQDDAHGGKYGFFQPFTIAWATIGSGGTIALASVLDVFAQRAPTYVKVAANDRDEVVVLFYDAADSNANAAIYSVKRDDIIDIRSTTASATFYARLFPVFEQESTY